MQTYQSELWVVEKDVIYYAIGALKDGIENSKNYIDCLKEISFSSNPAVPIIEREIAAMERSLEKLQNCKIDEAN